MSDDDFAPYDADALQSLIDHLAWLMLAGYEELNSFQMVAQIRGVPGKLSERLAGWCNEMTPTQVLTRVGQFLGDLEHGASQRLEAQKRGTGDAGWNARDSNRISRGAQLSRLVVWCSELRLDILAWRVEAVPLEVRVRAGREQLERIGLLKWADRVRRHSCREGRGILEQVCTSGTLDGVTPLIMRRVQQALGIDDFPNHERRLWLGRHGLDAYDHRHEELVTSLRNLAMAWWDEAQIARKGLRPQKRVVPLYPAAVWYTGDQGGTMFRLIALGNGGQTVVGFLFLNTQDGQVIEPGLPGDTIFDDGQQLQVVGLGRAEIGTTIGWFCETEPANSN